jgi:hypothetical protein
LEEIWETMIEFEGNYEVSNLGNIRNKTSKRNLSQHLINSGYLKTNIKYKGKSHNRLVHRLVAQYFCNGFREDLQVNHINAVRTDNRSVNLEWVTPKENIQDTISRGTFNVSSAHEVAHERRKRPVAQIDSSGSIVNTFESAREAAKSVGIHENCISRVCRGERIRSKGYQWMYLKEESK